MLISRVCAPSKWLHLAPFFAAKNPFRQFSDAYSSLITQQSEELKQTFWSQKPSFSTAEFNIVDYYTSNSPTLNHYLRIQGRSPYALVGRDADTVTTYCEQYYDMTALTQQLDTLIQKTALPFDAIVYRGIKAGIPLQSFRVGSILKEPGYLSTTPFYKTATNNFTGHFLDKDRSGKFVFRIKVKSGTPCLNPDVYYPDKKPFLKELLFPRNNCLKITHIRPAQNGLPTIVDAELFYT